MRYRAFATILVGLALAACGGGATTTGSTQTSSTPFNIRNVNALSGPTSSTAIACTNGMQGAALEVNRQGGILGHKVQIKNYDDASNATQAVNLLQQALNSGTTWNFSISGGSSDENLAEMAGLNGAKILNVSNASATQLGDPKQNPYHFGISTTPALTSKYLVDYVAKQNYKKVGLFTYDGAFGQSENQTLSAELKAHNIPFVNMSFSQTAVDLSPQLLQLKDQGVDAVVWSDLGAQIGYTMKSRAKIGWFIPFIGDLGVSSSDTYALAGGDPTILQNQVIMQFAVDVYKPLDQQTPVFRKFWDNIHSVAVTINQPLHLYVTCYDILIAFKATAEKLNTLDSDKIKAEWEKGWKPASGSLVWASTGWGWTPDSHRPVNVPEEFTYIKIGKATEGQVTPGS
jgi:branched-chain amino acid transport system substrate-binding protein